MWSGQVTSCITKYHKHLSLNYLYIKFRPLHGQVEISLQPWRAFQPDGVILFSDILTPLTGMNIPFDITTGKGPIIHDPIRTMEVSRARNVNWYPNLTANAVCSCSGISLLENAKPAVVCICYKGSLAVTM